MYFKVCKTIPYIYVCRSIKTFINTKLRIVLTSENREKEGGFTYNNIFLLKKFRGIMVKY